MAATSDLLDRIDAEFDGVDQKIKEFQKAQAQEFEGRQQRLEQFVSLCDKLSEVWGPRLEAFAAKFQDRVQANPVKTKARRSVTYSFTSPLARFDLSLSAMTDVDVRHLVLDYSLEILPILMNFENHRQLELPLDDADPAVIEKWIDDRLVEAVRTYLQLNQNANYLKGHLVVDPVAKVEFPKYAAGATLEWKGKTYYFIGAESRDAFARENQIS